MMLNACESASVSAGSDGAKILGAVDWLALAAAPTFVIMALLTSILGGTRPDAICSAMQDASPMNGTALMYLLMSVFHSAPWLKLISRRTRTMRSSKRSPIRPSGAVKESGQPAL
jgi:hypothetical protein